MPATASLAGLPIIISYAMSHSVVEVQGTDWMEPVLLRISICMPTGSGKSSLCKLLKMVKDARSQCGLDDGPLWMMGELMEENHWKLLGLYDELPMFLSQVNICRGSAPVDSQQVAIFLQLYSGDAWIRKIGEL